MLLWRSGPHYCAASLKKALFSVFVRLKVSFYENTSFTNYASGIRLPNCSRLAINWKNGNDGIIFWHYVIFKISWPYFISFVRFSYWSKFHVKIITCSGAMTIPFYNGLTRNPENGNTPVWVLPNILRLAWVRINKLGTNVCSTMLLNVAKSQGYSFYRFWVIKGKPTEGKISPPPPSPSLPFDFESQFEYLGKNTEKSYFFFSTS